MKFSLIVPTLNESSYIHQLLTSIRRQGLDDYEIIVVDGGSHDGTRDIAESFGARVYTVHGSGEFAARNFGATHAIGQILVFTCADIVFTRDLLLRIHHAFSRNRELIAVTCPDIPYDGSFGLKFEYYVYNLLRYLMTKLPYSVRRFSTSTNFLAVRRDAFNEIGGFQLNDVNADGILGRNLLRFRHVMFDRRLAVYASARREANWGFVRFNLHYLYVLENFFHALSKSKVFASLKMKSLDRHRELHTIKSNT